MTRALVRPPVCAGCEPCPALEGCPMRALFRESPTDKPWVDFYRCTGCQRCKTLCPHDAIEFLTQACGGKMKMGW